LLLFQEEYSLISKKRILLWLSWWGFLNLSCRRLWNILLYFPFFRSFYNKHYSKSVEILAYENRRKKWKSRNTIPWIKKDHSVNPQNQSINKLMCCIIPGIREGFNRLIEQNKHPELRWLPNVRSKLYSINRICKGFFMVKKSFKNIDWGYPSMNLPLITLS
jgi:hypothetical protein